MAACISCRTLVELLKNQINDLTAKEQQLVRINNALTQALRNTESVSHMEEASWREKYESEAKINIELRRRVAELENLEKSHFYSTFQQPATPKKQSNKSQLESAHRTSYNNQNHRSNSISRMDEFMKQVCIPKVGQFSTRRTTLTNIKKAKGEIVLRIVDDRLNRKY